MTDVRKPVVPDRCVAADIDRNVLVPSPLVLAFAGSFAAGNWYVSRNGDQRGGVATKPGAVFLDFGVWGAAS